jgi:hypothetical protein
MTESRDVLAHDASAATGNGSALDVKDMAVAAFQVTGTFVATITFEATVDDANWVSLRATNVSGGATATTATAPGIYSAGVAGLHYVRARISAWTSGSVTCQILALHVGDQAGVESVQALPSYVEIAKGNLANHTAVNKFGRNGAVGSSAEPVWDFSATYDYLADDTFATMYISSDNSADQGLTYSVTGIDSDYNYSTVTVTTDGSDGTTFVALASGADDDQWWRVFRAVNTSGTAAQGNIYISKDNTDVGGNGIPDDTSDIQAQILIGNEQTLMALWTSPVDFTSYLTLYYASTSSSKVTNIYLFVRPFGGVFNMKHVISINANHISHEFSFPLVINGKSDIKVEADAAGGGGVVDAGFDLWFEPA